MSIGVTMVTAGAVCVAGGMVLLELGAWAWGTALWLLGLGAATWGIARLPAVDGAPALTVGRREWVIVGGLTATALLLRAWDPEGFPSGIHVDEAAMGLVALDVARGQGPHPFGFAFIGDPVPFMYVEGWSMRLFGESVASLRLVAALAGALGVPIVWWWGRSLFGPRVGLVAAGLLVASASHLHFSRMALNIIEIPLFGTLAMALQWRGVTTGRPLWHLLAGMSLGMGQYANFGARAFMLAVAGTYAWCLVRRPGAWRRLVAGGLWAVFGLMLVFGPQLAHVRDEPAQLWDRLQYRSVFRRWDQATEIHGTTNPVGVMAGQVLINLRAFFDVSDRGPFYEFAERPLLSIPMALVFAAGLALALARMFEPRFASLLLACAGVILAGALSAGSPQFHRLVPMLPVACLLGATAVCWLVRRAPSIPAVTALAGLLVWNALDGTMATFAWGPARHPFQPHTAWARWAADQQPGSLVLLAGMPEVGAFDERFRLLARSSEVRDVPNPAIDVPAAFRERRQVVLGVGPGLDEWLPLLDELLVTGAPRPIRDVDGVPTLLEFVPISLADVGDAHGLRRELTSARRNTAPSSLIDLAIAFREASRLAPGGQFRAEWRGSLLVERAGDYRLDVFTDGGAELELDGKVVATARPSADPRSIRADVHFEPGPHPIELRYSYIRGPGILELRWRPPDAERHVIPPSALRPG